MIVIYEGEQCSSLDVFLRMGSFLQAFLILNGITNVL